MSSLTRFEALGSEDEVCAPAVPDILVARPLCGRWRTSAERTRFAASFSEGAFGSDCTGVGCVCAPTLPKQQADVEPNPPQEISVCVATPVMHVVTPAVTDDKTQERLEHRDARNASERGGLTRKKNN